jgi:hypothetical protein
MPQQMLYRVGDTFWMADKIAGVEAAILSHSKNAHAVGMKQNSRGKGVLPVVAGFEMLPKCGVSSVC